MISYNGQQHEVMDFTARKETDPDAKMTDPDELVRILDD